MLLVFFPVSPFCFASFLKQPPSPLWGQAEHHSWAVSYEKGVSLGFWGFCLFVWWREYFKKKTRKPHKAAFPVVSFFFSLNCSHTCSLLLCWGYGFTLQIRQQYQLRGFPSDCLCPAACDPLRCAAAVVRDISLAGELIHFNNRHAGH